MSAPRILSLAVDEETQARWDEVRRAHFPAERLLVGAHVTLFHALPADLEVEAALASATARRPFDVRVAGVRSLGRGVAYDLESEELATLHRDLQQRWEERLTRQDRQPLRPHVTVQNKVDPTEAKATLAQLREDFRAYDVTALGLDLWRYDDGPWTHLRRFELGS
ncbi:hypothetical protein GCM10011519_29970 [Marmoricola endophyticus]|uniref:2'-5' RNA ligase family protein n=1 Tax=Marmoricola endophyticus TaxID=2040280 RepID=A0A917BPD1_9ACTN|nr:2'-5' RNA ligase family protein [Marmoricola endophyticus]GGF54052.1 hypothetical protein GCM10011519_29970 [Marmoricola endophyticus]